MEINEKTAYLKGLADGLGLDPESKEGKLFAALIDTVDEMARQLTEVSDHVDEVDEDLADLEEWADELSESCDACCDDDEDDDDDLYQCTCPTCHQTVYFSEEDIGEDDFSMKCPHCGEIIPNVFACEDDECDCDSCSDDDQDK